MRRIITPEELAFAYELRVEYGLTWKRIARIVGYEAKSLCKKVNRAIRGGLSEVYPERTYLVLRG